MTEEELNKIIKHIQNDPDESISIESLEIISKGLRVAELLKNTRQYVKINRFLQITDLWNQGRKKEADIELKKFDAEFPGWTAKDEPEVTFGLLLEAINLTEQGIY